MMRRALLLILVLAAGGGERVAGQSLRDQCAADLSMTCSQLAEAALTLQPRLAIAAAGGNPVSGTASTLGMRVPGSPRWSVAVRGTAARATLPPMPPAAEATSSMPWSINADLSVGVFTGFQLLPTIGGFGSLDVLGSIGLLSAEDEGFEQDSRVTWGLGASVGILRESFTAPGVTLSGMYRSVPGVTRDEAMEIDAQRVLSLRGTVGKRILGVGLTGGIAWDHGSGDVRVRYVSGVPDPVTLTSDADVSYDRTSFFGNLSYTLMILNLSAELGWQSGGDVPAGAHEDAGSGGVFGGLAIRLAI